MAARAQRPERRPHGPKGPEAARPAAARGSGDPLLGLQRRAGNRAVQALLGAGPDLARSRGVALDPTFRAAMESRLGQDLSRVRIHASPLAAASARALGTPAYTVGRQIVVDPGRLAPSRADGRAVLAHELTHVVQQDRARPTAGIVAGSPGDAHEHEARRVAGTVSAATPPAGRLAVTRRLAPGAPLRIQRYEAGEHAQLGETGAELRALATAGATLTYRVRPGDTLRGIAARFSVSLEELRRLNAAKLRRWPVAAGGGATVTGFEAGEEIQIPPVLGPTVEQMLKTNELTFTVKGKTLEYGVGIAMADYFEDPEQLANAREDEVEAIANLIRRERQGKPVDTEEWNKATNGRYVQLAERNEAHFAPPDPGLVTPSRRSRIDHKAQWERYHELALNRSQAGDKNEALRVNAFADHFLTDAFAGGHLINKRDVMVRFQQRLPLTAEGEFTPDASQFFDSVAKEAFVGPVKEAFSEHETVEKLGGGVFRPNINSVSRFAELLRAIHKEEPDLVANAIARAVHNRLNQEPGGIPVANARGDPPWNLSGDGTLNPESRKMALQAVARSQLNVLQAYKIIGPPNYPALFKQVWDYVPRPTGEGAATVRAAVEAGTDPKQPALVTAVAKLITDNYKLILEELVKRNKLRRA
jgi:LysM repeat protein